MGLGQEFYLVNKKTNTSKLAGSFYKFDELHEFIIDRFNNGDDGDDSEEYLPEVKLSLEDCKEILDEIKTVRDQLVADKIDNLEYIEFINDYDFTKENLDRSITVFESIISKLTEDKNLFVSYMFSY